LTAFPFDFKQNQTEKATEKQPKDEKTAEK
jgi:hypothetical protein